MPFCTNCGNENPVGVRFCSKCGTELGTIAASCHNCGKTLEKNEKFCSGCGTPVTGEPTKKESKTVEPKPVEKEGKFTKEGRKIIDAGPKPNQFKSKPQGSPSPTSRSKKKKRSFMGCLGKSLLILLGVLIVGVVIIWNLPDDEENKLTDTNIPGIVDIEPEGENSTGSSETYSTNKQMVKPIKENNDVKKTAKIMEDIFAKSDTIRLKELLSEKSLETYAGVFDDIYPHMPDYAKAFKNRKLKISKNALSVYEFKDENEDVFLVTFEMQANGSWKLINF